MSTHTLSPRTAPFELPSYSLTGDVLSFLRCELQYRYNGIGKLPPSDAVQHWYGQFIHGCMEEAFRHVQQHRQAGESDEEALPPWDEEFVRGEIIDVVAQRLRFQGVAAWSDQSFNTGVRRAVAAINELGPHLFPLIRDAEVQIRGTRPIDSENQEVATDVYEIRGIIDVISNVELSNPEVATNPIVEAVRAELPSDLPDAFEVIVDYKGQRRPPLTHRHWMAYEQQLQTYAHLRRSRPGNAPVVAGVLVYLNELAHSRRDLDALWQEIQEDQTDVSVEEDSETYRNIQRLRRSSGEWDSGQRPEDLLPMDFRLRRSLRVIPITDDSIREALSRFDGAAAEIEERRRLENETGNILDVWNPHYEQATCDRCDARSFCPEYPEIDAPTLPSS